MRKTRATRAAVTLSYPTCHDTDDDDPTHLWQNSFVDLLYGAAQYITTPSVFVLQTNDWKGLSQVAEQTPMDYALTLIGCGIVSVNESKQIRNKVEVHEDKLKEILGRRHLMMDLESNSSCWVSKGRVYEGALKEKMSADAPPVSETKAADMLTLRIGKIAHGGKAPPGAKHINGRKDRPKFSWKMRKVLTEYQRTIRPLVTKAYFNEKMRSDARIVAQWMVDPPQLFKRKQVKRVNPQAKQPTKDTPNSPPKKKVNTAATPKRGTEVAEGNGKEIMSQQLQDDLMDVFRKHGLLDKLKEQLPQDDLKQALTTTPKQSSATTAFVTPFHSERPREEPSEEPTTTVNPATDITDPPQLNDVSPSEAEKKQFPVLSKLAPRVLQRDRDCVGGMDMDQILCDAILREIVKFKSNRGETVGYESANSHSSHTLLDVPFVDKDNKKVPDMNRVLTQVMSMAEPGSERIMVESVIDHLVKSHNAATREVLRERKISHRNMDQYDLATIMDILQMKSWQMEGLQQCLKQFLDVDKVSVAKDKVQALSEGYGDITHGTFYYNDPNKPGTTAEKIRYWWKDPVIETVASVTGLVNGYNLTPEDISFIHAVYGGDHGKNKFRFCGKVVIRTKDGKYYDDVFGLADVACKKDNGIVLDGTVLPQLMEGINVMETSGFVFHTVNVDGSITYQIDTTEQPPATALPLQYYLKPTCFIAGDLAFLAIIMGKEGFASSWCNWCDLDHNEWAKKDHNRGTLWTYERIEEQHKQNQAQEWDDERRKGIRRTPYTKIPFNRIIFSVLHAMIGVGDLIITHLEEFVDGEIEELNPIEMQMRNELTNKSEARAESHEEWQHWKQSELGGKLLAKKQRRVRYIDTISMKKVDAIINNNELTEQERTDASAAKEALTAEKADLVNAIPALVAQGKTRKKVWEELDTEISALKAKLRECTKERRTSDDSYYTGMDRIFQDEGANRAAHFGRKFNGVNLRTIMEKADDLFGNEGGRIRQYLLEKAPAKEDLINEKCNDIRDALVLWDAAFSKLRTVDPTPDDCNQAQQMIDVAVAQLRKMDINITPKVHGTQYHAVNQMRTIRGGIAKLGEDWIEKYHQDGFRYDLCYGRVGDLERQAVIRARCEHRARNPQVVMRKELLAKRFKGKRKKKSTTVKEVQKQIKEEKRHEVLLRKLEEDAVELY